jgi:hypothetical protein
MKKKGTKLGKAIIAGLKEALAYERGKISLRTMEVELPSPAHEFSKKEVKELREKVLHVSQPILFQFRNQTWLYSHNFQ